MSKQEIVFQHVENWKRSGLTQATYCEGHNLKTHTFSYWVIKYQKQHTHLDSESAFITIENKLACLVVTICTNSGAYSTTFFCFFVCGEQYIFFRH